MPDFFRRLGQSLASGALIAFALFVGWLWLETEISPSLDRRQFMWDCVTARGIVHEQQCAAEFPAVEAARRDGWSAR